jgi:hypothetical protein
MKFTKFILMLCLSLMLTAQVFSQARVIKDSTAKGDTVKTFTIAGYEEIYVDVYNSNADSSNTVSFFGVNFSGWEIPAPMVDVTASYNYSTVTSATVTISTKKTFKLRANGYNSLKIVNNKYNGLINKVYYEVRGIRKTQF